MKVSKIIVKNYRSIKKVEIKPSNLSIFVGQNNHGKTNFFEAPIQLVSATPGLMLS